METYVDEEEGVHDFSEELDLGVKISTDEAEIVAPSLTETQANSRFLSGDLSASRSPRFSNPTIERQNSFKYRKSARTAPTERSENGTRSQPEVIAAVDPRREYQSGYDEIETRVRSTPPNVPLKKASSPKSPRNPNSTSAGSSPRLSSASHDGPGQHQSPRNETTPHSASRNGNGSAAPLASASQDFPVAPTLAAAPSLSPAPAPASAPTGAAPAPKTTRSPVPASNRESISRRAEPNKRLSGIPAPSPQPTQKSASKPAFSTTSAKSVPVHHQKSAPKSASKPAPTTELLSPIRARNFEEALKSATTSTRPVTPSRTSRSTTPTSLRRPQYSLEHLPIHGAVTPTIDGKDWNSSVRVKKPSANQEAAEHLNLIKQDSGEKPLGPRLRRKPSSDSLNRLSSQGQGQADTHSTGAQSRLSTGNGTNIPSSLFSPVSQRKYTATGGPRSQATSRSATPTSQLRPASSTSSRPSSRPSSRSTTPTNASNRRGPSLAAYFNDEMTDISAENSQLNGAGGASSVSPRGSTPASASMLSPYNLMVAGPHGTLDSAHLSDADLQSVGKQMLLLKLMLQAKTSADNEKEEADILHAWNVVHAAEEQARLMATQDSGIEEITRVHQQIIDMEAVIDKLNDHLAPAFERLAAYNNAKAEQLASTSSDIVDPLLDAYSPRAHAHKELQARLAGLSRSLAALKRTVDQEGFVAPTAEALASASLSSVSAGEPESALNAEQEQELEREQDRNVENIAAGEGEKKGEERGLEQPAEETEVAVEQIESVHAQAEDGGEPENGENAHVAASTVEEPVIAATASPAPQKVIPSATAVRVRATPARDTTAATHARSTSPAPSVRSASPAPVKRLSINQGPILTSRDAATPKNARMRAPTSTAAPSVPPSQANRAKSPAPAGAAAARGGSSSAGHMSVTARTTAASLAGTRSKSPAPATAAAANKHTPTATTGSPRSSTSGASGTSGGSPRSLRVSIGAASAIASAASSNADVIAHGKEPKFVPRVKKVVEPVEASAEMNVAPASTAEFDNEVEHTTTTTTTDPLTTDSLEVNAEVVQDEAEEVEEVNEEVRTADKDVAEVVKETETEELNEIDAELIDETAEDYSVAVPTATTTATTVPDKVESVEKVDTVPSTTAATTTTSTTASTTTTASAAPSTSTTTSTTNPNKYAEIKIPSFRKTPIDLNPYLPTTYTTLTDTESSVVTAPAEPVTSVDAHLNSMFEMVRLSEDSADEASVKGGSVKESSIGAKDCSSGSGAKDSGDGSEGTGRPSTPPRVGPTSTTSTTNTTTAADTTNTPSTTANTTATSNTTTPSNTTEETTVEASPGKKARGEAFERLMKRLNQNKEAGENSNTHTPGGSGRTSPSTTVPLPLSVGEESSVGSVVGSGAGVASSPASKNTVNAANATSTTNTTVVPATPVTSTTSVSVFNSPEPTSTITTTASTATPSNTNTTNTTTNDTSTEETITRRPSVAEMLAKFGGKATSSPVPNRVPSPVTTTPNTPFNATNTINTTSTTNTSGANSTANVLSVDTSNSGAGSTPVSPSNKVVSPTNTSANNTTPNGGLKRVQSTRVSELMNKFGGSRKDLLVPTPSPTVYSVGTSGTSGSASASGGVSGGSGSRRGSVQAIGSITPKKAVYENTDTNTTNTNTTNTTNATSPTNNTSRAKSPSYRASSGTKSPGSLSPHNSAYNLTTTTTTTASPKSSVGASSAAKSPRSDKSPLRSPTNTTNTTTNTTSTSGNRTLSPVNRTTTSATGTGGASPKRGSVSSVSPTNKQDINTTAAATANTSASASGSTGLKSIPSFTSTNVISTVSTTGATPTSPLSKDSKDSGVLKSSPSFNSAFTVPATTSNTTTASSTTTASNTANTSAVDSNSANTATANSRNDNTVNATNTANTSTVNTSTTANVTVNATFAPHAVEESSVGKSSVGVVSNKDVVAEQSLPSYEEAVSNTASTTTSTGNAATTVLVTAGASADSTAIGDSVVLEGASASVGASTRNVVNEAGLPTYEEATVNTSSSTSNAATSKVASDVEEAPPSYEQAVDHTTGTSNTTVTSTIPASTSTTTTNTTNTVTPADTTASTASTAGTANTTSTTASGAYTVPPAITITPVSEPMSVPTTHTTHTLPTTPTHTTPTNLHSTSKDGVAAVDYTSSTNTTNTSTSGTARTPPSAAPRSRTSSGHIQKTGSGGVSTPNNANTTTANTTTANTTGSPRSTTLHSSSAESEGSAEWGTGWEMSASQDVNDGYLSRALSLDPDSPRSSNGNRPGTAHSYGSSNNSGVYSNNHSLNVSHSDEFIRVRDASHLATVREGLSENENEAEEEVQISNTSGVNGSSNVQGVQGEVDLADAVSAKLTAHWVASKSAENVYGTSASGTNGTSGSSNDRGMYVNVDHDADISTIGSLSDDRTVHSVRSGVYVGGGSSSNVNNANPTTHTTHTTHAYPTTTYAHGQPSPAAQQHTNTFHTSNTNTTNTNPNHTTNTIESGPNTPLTPNTPYTPSTPLTSVVNVSHKDDTNAGASVRGEQENEYEGSDAGSIAGSTASKKKRRPTLKGLWKRMGVN